MNDRQQQRHSALVFGARKLGRVVIERLLGAGCAVAGVARSQETLAGVTVADSCAAAPARSAFMFLSGAGGFLVEQGRAATHELRATPLAESWVP